MRHHAGSPGRRGLGSAGVSLVEALAVLALVTLLAAHGLPALEQARAQRRLEGAALALRADLQWLRQASLARQESLRWQWTDAPGQGSCHLLHRGPAGSCHCDPQGGPPRCSAEGEALRQTRWPAQHGLRLQANVAGLAVDPGLGTVTPSGTLRLVQAGGGELRLVVSALGRVRVCAAGASGSPGHAPC